VETYSDGAEAFAFMLYCLPEQWLFTTLILSF